MPEAAARAMLRRAVTGAAQEARDEAGFFAVLRTAGVQVRLRFSETDPAQVTGYAVTLPGRAGRGVVQGRAAGRWAGFAAAPAAVDPAGGGAALNYARKILRHALDTGDAQRARMGELLGQLRDTQPDHVTDGGSEAGIRRARSLCTS